MDWVMIVRNWEWQAGPWRIARRRVAADSLEFVYDLWLDQTLTGTHPTLRAAQDAAEKG